MYQIEPLVSVLFPVNNLDQNAIDALKSILNQTYHNLEVLIMDTSNHFTSSKSNEFFNLVDLDPRVKHISLPSTLNLSESLNYGLTICLGEFIARMDSDDISFNNRIRTQVDYLIANPEIHVLGSAIQILDGFFEHPLKHGQIVVAPARENIDIHVWALEKNPIFHPTVIFRKSIKSDVVYNPRYRRAQDYELWVRLLRKYNLDNIQSPLLYYRIHQNQAGVTDASLSKLYSNNAQLKHAIWMIMRKRKKLLILKIILKRLASLTIFSLKKISQPKS